MFSGIDDLGDEALSFDLLIIRRCTRLASSRVPVPRLVYAYGVVSLVRGPTSALAKTQNPSH